MIAAHSDDSRLNKALQKTNMDWTLCFIGEVQHEKLGELNADLQRDFDPNGNGKRIESGFAYWGPRPSYEWTKACGDDIYRVMRDGIDSFPERWRALDESTAGRHYVSLGIGTGEKDAAILSTLLHSAPDLYFFPVDMSSDLMRRGVLNVLRQVGLNDATPRLERSHVLPVLMDFSLEQNLNQLRLLLDEIVADDPVLFGLLGNTLANFESEATVLRALPGLVRPNKDVLLIETASTPDTAPQTLSAARNEYSGSRLFRSFAISSLAQNTNLPLDMNQLVFSCVERDGSLRIDTLYKSTSDGEFTLIGGDRVAFPRDDTIRLYISRKYTEHGLAELLRANGLRVLHTLSPAHTRRRFGTTLTLCQFDRSLLESMLPLRTPEQEPPLEPRQSLGPRRAPPKVFISYCGEDREWLHQLRKYLEPSVRNGDFELWHDAKIETGQTWLDEIDWSLRTCDVAVLLVTQNFLNSDFIARIELPRLLQDAKQKRLELVWIPIADSTWRETPLAKLQAAFRPERPLNHLDMPEQQTRLRQIADRIRDLARARSQPAR